MNYNIDYLSQEIHCYHCNKIWYINRSFRLSEAKTVSCFYCGKRINKEKMLNNDNPQSKIKEGIKQSVVEDRN